MHLSLPTSPITGDSYSSVIEMDWQIEILHIQGDDL